MFGTGARDGPSGGITVRIAALFFGLVAGLFALLAPSAMRTDVMAQFMALWSDTSTDQLIGTVIWYGIPSAAIVGALIATVMPGLAVIPLAAAALGWVSMGLALGKLGDYELLAPAASAGLAALLSLVAAELAVRRRRIERRRRRSLAEDEDEGDDIEREAALRMDPLSMDRDAAPPPRRAVPLNIDDIEAVSERPQGQPPRWQDLDAPAPRQGRPDIWGEAIRPQPDYVVEPEPLPPEPEIEIEPEPEPVRGFRWDRADAPIGHGMAAGDRAGPRLVRRPTVEAVAEPVRARAPEPPQPFPVAPQPLRAPPEMSVEPPTRQRWTPPHEPRRRGNGLLAALSAVVAVLVLGALLAGGYLAYRDGWIDRLIGVAKPEGGTAPAVVAATESAIPELPEQVLGEPSAPSPEPAAIAVLPSKPAATADAAAGVEAAALAEAPPSPGFADPFAYCRSVGTIDYVDDRYSGPMVTAEMTRALAVPGTAARDRVHWRCIDGTVVACASYIGPVCDMAPTVAEMKEYCAQYPTAKQLMAPGGVWSCINGRPRLPPEAKWPVDARGFRADTWVVVSPQAGAPAG
jgi:hypothetical protein